MCCPFSHIGVRGTMKPIAPHSIVLVQFKGDGINKCFHGNSLVEGCVKYSNLWCIGENSPGNFNARQVRRIVQRSQGDILLDSGNNLLINNCGRLKGLTAMDYAMSYSGYFRFVLNYPCSLSTSSSTILFSPW